MKSSKSSIKAIVQGAVLGVGMLVAGSVFADGFGHGHGRDFDDRRGHEWHGRDFGDHRGHEWHGRDFDRHYYDRGGDRGGIRFVVPVPPHPPIFFPIPRPPHVTFSFGAPVAEYITYARVVDVDPILSRRYGDSDGSWDDSRGACEGYRVTYEFRGVEYTTVMSYDPGNQVRIRVGRGIEVLG